MSHPAAAGAFGIAGTDSHGRMDPPERRVTDRG
jgi:hypothetical protein